VPLDVLQTDLLLEVHHQKVMKDLCVMSVPVGHRSRRRTSGEEHKSIINGIGFPNASFRINVFPKPYETDGATFFCTISSSFVVVLIDATVSPMSLPYLEVKDLQRHE
jgi:hypothetical protein